MSTLAKEPITYNVGKNLLIYYIVKLALQFFCMLCAALDDDKFVKPGTFRSVKHMSSVHRVPVQSKTSVCPVPVEFTYNVY